MLPPLGSLLAYLHFDPALAGAPGKAGAGSRSRWLFYALALALYLAALLSKTVTASLPGVLLVIAWWKHGRIARVDVARVVPFFCVGLALSAVTVWMEKYHVGAAGTVWNLSFVDRLLLAGRALWFYAAKLVWPHPLIFFYPRWTIDAGAWWQYAFPLAAVARRLPSRAPREFHAAGKVRPSCEYRRWDLNPHALAGTGF